MKKYLFNIFVLVLATMVGCQKSEVEGVLEESNNSANKITVTADIANDGQTRVALTPDTDGEGKPIVKVACFHFWIVRKRHKEQCDERENHRRQ